MRENEQYAGGLSLDFFDSIAFEEEKPGEETENLIRQTRNLLRLLMTGWHDEWRSLLSRRTFNAVFIARDHEMTKAMRLAFQQGFDHVFSQLDGKVLSPQQQNQAQLYISNCLTFLPFADITPYESIAIPQYVDNKWQLIDYKVVPIELTPTSGFKKLFIHEYDRVFAYGLEPISHPNAEPHLIFMGTTYPAGQGFSTTIKTDLEAFETAGKKLYREGHKKISDWLNRQHPKKTHVCGTSLGGALSLLVAIDQGDKLSRVDALNPPGLYHPWRKSRFDHWDELAVKPAVYIQKQGNDPVSIFGVWKPDWNVLHVIPPADKQGPNSVADHALNYAGFSDTQFIHVDPAADNEERRLRNFLLYSLLRSAVYYFVMVPYHHLMLPFVRFVLNHKLQTSIMLSFVALFHIIPTLLPIVLTTSLAMNVIVSAAISSYWLTELIRYASDKANNKSDSHLSQLIKVLAEKPRLGATIGLLTFIVTSAVVASFIFFPPLTPFLMVTIASAPLVYFSLEKIITNLRTLFGFNTINTPDFQHPTQSRNESLDIYNNTMDATFSYKEIGEYYQAKRCVLKGKPFLPEEQQTSSPRFFKQTRFTKREVLIKSQDLLSQNDTITITASKAKIHDMQHTLRLFSSLNEQSRADLKLALQHSHDEYLIGKHLT